MLENGNCSIWVFGKVSIYVQGMENFDAKLMILKITIRNLGDSS